MRISQLSGESGVPVATIKFYLREHLLHDGLLTSATQARYDETHLARLRLIKALMGPGGLTVAATRRVLQAIESPPVSTHDLLGAAHEAVTDVVETPVDLTRAHALMERWGWSIEEKDCHTHETLARSLEALDAADFPLPDEALDAYAQAMAAVAEGEVESVPTDSAAAAVRYVVLGTVLVEPLLLTLRRMAQQQASGRRFGSGSGSGSVSGSGAASGMREASG